MQGVAEKLVKNDEEYIRSAIDVLNVLFEESNRIKDTEYRFFEALVWAQKEFGGINSASAEEYIKERIGKPNWARKMFRDTRNSLHKKGWIAKDGDIYFIPPQLDFFNKRLPSEYTVLLKVHRDEVMGDTNSYRED